MLVARLGPGLRILGSEDVSWFCKDNAVWIKLKVEEIKTKKIVLEISQMVLSVRTS